MLQVTEELSKAPTPLHVVSVASRSLHGLVRLNTARPQWVESRPRRSNSQPTSQCPPSHQHPTSDSDAPPCSTPHMSDVDIARAEIELQMLGSLVDCAHALGLAL